MFFEFLKNFLVRATGRELNSSLSLDQSAYVTATK